MNEITLDVKIAKTTIDCNIYGHFSEHLGRCIYEGYWVGEDSHIPNVRGIRTDKWKFIRYPHGNGEPDQHLFEFYDLENDPNETTNLSQSPQHQVSMMRMNNELLRMLSDLRLENDPIPLDEGIQNQLPAQSIR